VRSTPYSGSGSVLSLEKAWQSVRSCEAVSTNPALRLGSAHILAPRRRRPEGSSREQNAPRPEHVKRAIWAGRAARSRTAASTDRGRASNSGSGGSEIDTVSVGATISRTMVFVLASSYRGQVFGVITEALAARGLAHRGVTRLDVVSSMHERKETMVARADGFVALPGGFGTNDELFEVLTSFQLGLHQKPCAVLNVAGYFDGLLAFLDRAAEEGLLRHRNRAMLVVERDPVRLVQRFRRHTPPVVETWLRPGQRGSDERTANRIGQAEAREAP
jgi:uncharacterized protein (TIGR00730 family)